MVELRVFSLGAAERVPTLVYSVLIAAFCIGTILSMRMKGWRDGLRYGAMILLVEWMFLVLGICVFFRESSDEYRFNIIPLMSYFDYGENSYFMEKAALNILNVALFVPVGFLLGCGFRKMTWQKTLAIGFILSIFIEILQLIYRRGLCEIDDVIHNVAGCMIGFGICNFFSKSAKLIFKMTNR